jgi:hypothetical protein
MEMGHRSAVRDGEGSDDSERWFLNAGSEYRLRRGGILLEFELERSLQAGGLNRNSMRFSFNIA